MGRPTQAFAKEIFVVFAPLPTTQVRLESVLDVIHRLQSAPAGHERVLWLEDWTAGALNCVGASPQCIRGFYELLLFGLRSLAPDLMKQVRVCWQEQMILSGASEYWISVINIGRKSSLEDIRGALPDEESLESASQVFSTLMHVADVLAFGDAQSLTLCCDKYHQNLHAFAARQYESLGLKRPKVMVVEPPALRLLEAGEGLEPDVHIMLTDKEVEVNKKVKKSFCMPQNTDFCPPLAWTKELLSLRGEFLVSRKPDNGGDKTYTDIAAITADFASGALHPGDVKPALGKALNLALEPLRADLAKQDALKKAQKDLDAHAKAQAKKK